jgi:pyruvate-formate lyase-activating enzyme
MIRTCTGERKLAGILKAMQDEGGHHVMLTLLPTGVPPREKLADIADLVLTDLKSIASTPLM